MQYAPGAGGRFLIVCCTTSNKVASWLPADLPDPVEYTQEKFCNPNKNQHMRTETQPPYSLSWFTRQYPFTRGDDLTHTQAEKLFLEDAIIANEVSHGRLVPTYYGKHYFPKWFTGKLITLVNDDETNAWLLERRKQVFYEYKNNKVRKLRFIPSHVTNTDVLAKYTDHPETEFDCTDIDKFVEQDYNENMSKQSGLNIMLKDYLTWHPDQIWDTVEPIVGSIDRDWCTPALKTWRKFWL